MSKPTTSEDRPPMLPPGVSGLPVIGDTVTMMRNTFAFIAQRQARYGPVFWANVLGRPTVFMEGPAAWVPFLDLENVTRERGRIASVQRLFGGQNLNSLDGTEHHKRKALLLQAFT